MTATEPTRETPTAPDPARLAAVAVLSAAGVTLTPALDLDAAGRAVRREMEYAALRGDRS